MRMQFFCLEKWQSNQIILTTVFTNQIDSTFLFKDNTDGCRPEIWWKRKSIQHTQQPAMSSSASLSDFACSNVSEDSLLERDLDNGEVEREKKVKQRFLFKLLLIRYRKKLRSKTWSPPRLIWADYAAELLHQNELNITFQMSASTFIKLVGPLRVSLAVDEKQALRSACSKDSSLAGCILPELVDWRKRISSSFVNRLFNDVVNL